MCGRWCISYFYEAYLCMCGRWCISYFSEAYRAWIHLKTIRVFVESVLRYGLPPKMVAMLIKPGRHEGETG